MLSTVLELTTTRFMTNRRSNFACAKISALPRSRCCLLFSLHTRVYLTFPLTKTYGYGRALRSLLLYRNSLFCDRLRLFAICDLRSTIVSDRLRSYGNQRLDRTWFYLLRTYDRDRRIAEVCFHMIADLFEICDMRSAIIWKPAFTTCTFAIGVIESTFALMKFMGVLMNV